MRFDVRYLAQNSNKVKFPWLHTLLSAGDHVRDVTRGVGSSACQPLCDNLFKGCHLVTQGLAKWVDKKLLDFLQELHWGTRPHPTPQIHRPPQ